MRWGGYKKKKKENLLEAAKKKVRQTNEVYDEELLH
jgi:hypothetical protein